MFSRLVTVFVLVEGEPRRVNDINDSRCVDPWILISPS